MDAHSSNMVRMPIDLSLAPDCRVGAATIHPSRLSVTGPDADVIVEPRVMQVLVVLCEAGGATVSRETFFERCWPGVIVGDDAVNRAIGEARKALRDSGAGAGIETIPRVGYRLDTFAQDTKPAGTGGEAAPRSAMDRRVMLAGGGLLAVGAAAGAWWLASRPSRDPRVQTLLDSGRQALREELPDRNAQGLGFLKEAAGLAPDDAEVLGLLAVAWRNAAEYAPEADAAAAAGQCESTAKRALRIDPDEGNALAALATLQPFFGDWTASEKRLLVVLDKAPESIPALSHLTTLYQSSGYLEESRKRNDQALALDPLSPVFQFRAALKHWIDGDLPRADTTIDRAVELWPRHPAVWNARLMLFAYTGRADAGRTFLANTALRPASLPAPALELWRTVLDALAGLPGAAAIARAASVQAAVRSVSGAHTALMYLSHVGELDTAFEVASGFLLRRGPLAGAGQSGSRQTWVTDQAWRRTMPLFTPATRPLRMDPRFAALAEGMGLTGYWKARGTPDFLAADRRAVAAG